MDYFLLWTFVSKCKLVPPKVCLRNEIHFNSVCLWNVAYEFDDTIMVSHCMPHVRCENLCLSPWRRKKSEYVVIWGEIQSIIMMWIFWRRERRFLKWKSFRSSCPWKKIPEIQKYISVKSVNLDSDKLECESSIRSELHTQGLREGFEHVDKGSFTPDESKCEWENYFVSMMSAAFPC